MTKDIRLGQRWRTAGGFPAAIEAVNDGRNDNADMYPWLARVWPMGTDMPSHTVTVTTDGEVFYGVSLTDPCDLAELVEDVIDEPVMHPEVYPFQWPALPTASADTPVTDALAGIGDIASTEKGSGARYNTGKAPFELIPLSIIAEAWLPYATGQAHDAAVAMASLGAWQERGDRQDLHDALQVMGLEGFYECAHVFDYGRRKYAEWNWAKGMKWSAVLACAARHLMKIIEGEQNDTESGLSHRGHFFCNVVMLLTYEFTFVEGDDRPAEGLLWQEPQPNIPDLVVEPARGDDLTDIAFERKRSDDSEGGAA